MTTVNSANAGIINYDAFDKNLDPTTLQSVQNITRIVTSYLKNVGNQGNNLTSNNDIRLDAPAADVDMADLAGLLLKLQSKSTDLQLSFGQEYLKTNKEQLEVKHKERIDKLLESFEKAESAKKTGLIGKIFGWIAVAITVIAAVAACIATGGIAVGAVVGALLAVTMMTLQETGAMDKIMEGLTDLLKKAGVGEPGSQILAALIITAIMIAVSVAAPSGAAAAAGKVASMAGMASKMVEGTMKVASMASMAEKFGTFAKTATNISKGVMIANQVGSGATGAAAGVIQHDSLKAQAEAKDIEKFLAKIQQQMEEEQDKIRELIEQLQSSVSVVVDIMKTDSELKSSISQRMAV